MIEILGCGGEGANTSVPLTVTSVLLPGLESDLRMRLHGQHLASKLVLNAVRDYLEMPQARKALALSFHGWSGTGKNFVARMLVDNLYRDGMRSDCVKTFISTFHFPHPKYVDMYKVRLQPGRAPRPSRGRALCWIGQAAAGR